ncbi:MAG: MoaD/ThiS family protein [Planctomycetes bacterium]|nr:MoaD/ThiS family protein [Planctomycetota bacterium]MBI3834040.1 MoaD/ThiS family protein [Planctomycetota bacterium]
MTVTVLFLGPARKAMGRESMRIQLDEKASLITLKNELATTRPAQAPMLKTVRFAINEQFATDHSELHDGDIVAIIPPVSGG